MLAHLKSGLLTAVAVLLVLAGAYKTGSRAARRAAELAQHRANTTAKRKADETRQNLDSLNDDAIRSRARIWMRSEDASR